jgi:glycosyltransferase involved in cell wall biosynthesis
MMTALPLVSVVTPTYNCAAWLPETLRSALGQTLPDVEIIVVDDGSTDDTRERLRAFAPRVRYLPMEHSGIPGRARNVGLRAARGEYVAFLDADDLWEPVKLERQIGLLEREPAAGLCVTDHVEFGVPGDGRTALDRVRHRLAAFPLRALDARAAVLEGSSVLADHLERGPLPLWTSAIAVRRRCFATVGGFNEEMPLDDDTQMWLRLIKHYSLVLVDEPLARRRIRPSSITATAASLDSHRGSLHTLDTLDRWIPLSPRERAATRAMAARIREVAGYHALAMGDHRQARQFLRQSLAARPSRSALVYLGLASLPRSAVRSLRAIKRRLSGATARAATASRA